MRTNTTETVRVMRRLTILSLLPLSVLSLAGCAGASDPDAEADATSVQDEELFEADWHCLGRQSCCERRDRTSTH